MTTVEPYLMEAMITNECTCVSVYDDPDTGDEVWNSAPECWGDCYEDSADLVTELIDSWTKRQEGLNKATNTVRIHSDAMGWQRAEGWLDINPAYIVISLQLNGDYRLRFKLEGTHLSVTRYSHDEPVGAHFTVTYIPDKD